MAALADKPERILRLIKYPEINKAGCYVVNLYINGFVQEVIIDDYFPVLPGTNKLAFGQSRDK